MKKEFEGATAEKSSQNPAPPAPDHRTSQDPVEQPIPRSVELMACIFYDICTNNYGIETQAFRYNYYQYVDGGFTLSFSSDIASNGTIEELDYPHYKKMRALLEDLAAQLDSNEDELFIDPGNLQISATNKMALLEAITRYAEDEENGIYAVDMVDPDRVICEEIMAPQELPTDTHSMREMQYVLARKFDQTLETDSYTKQVSDVVYIPRVFTSHNEYKVAMSTMLDTNVRTSLIHTMKTIQQEDYADLNQIPDTLVLGGFH